MSIRLSASEVLNAPVLVAAKLQPYQSFMLSPNQGFYHHARLQNANEEIPETFKAGERVRDRWNQIMLWKGIYCGKAHENRLNGFTAYACDDKNNLCCGHPEINGMLHTVGLGAWACNLLGHDLRHPMLILNGIINLDYDATAYYKVAGFGNPVEASRKIQTIEKEIFTGTILPYMHEISRIIQGN